MTAENELLHPNAIKWTINPLRLIFWGGLLCVFAFSLTTRTGDGTQYSFDLLNNAVGMLLITVGLLRLGAIPLGGSYPSLIRFLQIVAVGNLILEFANHFVVTFPLGITVVLWSFSLVTLTAIFLFCRAMCNLCKKAQLKKAERSWKITIILFLALYIFPVGLLDLLRTLEPLLGDLVDFNFNFKLPTPAVLLLIPVMALPLTSLFISTSRMKKGAVAAGANRVSMDGDDNFPMDRPRIPFQAMRSTFLWALCGSAAFLMVVMFFAGDLGVPGFQKGAGKVQYSGPDNDGEIDVDDVLIVDETGFREWTSYDGVFFVSPKYSMVNDECAFIIVPVLCGISPRVSGSGSAGWGGRVVIIGGNWNLDRVDRKNCEYQCTIPSGDNTSGTMEIGNERFSMADGQVFLVSWRPDGGFDVGQFKVPMSVDDPAEILRKLVARNEQVLALLVDELARALGEDERRRSHAGFALYRYDFATELPRELLLEELGKGDGWPCLMAAKALWETERHEQVIPALLDLLNRRQPSFPHQCRIVHEQVARLLGQIGPEARAAVPALREALNSDNERLTRAASESLKMIED